MESRSCPVCLSDYSRAEDVLPVSFSCGHSMCHDCLTAMVEISPNALCPVCRHRILSILRRKHAHLIDETLLSRIESGAIPQQVQVKVTLSETLCLEDEIGQDFEPESPLPVHSTRTLRPRTSAHVNNKQPAPPKASSKPTLPIHSCATLDSTSQYASSTATSASPSDSTSTASTTSSSCSDKSPTLSDAQNRASRAKIPRPSAAVNDQSLATNIRTYALRSHQSDELAAESKKKKKTKSRQTQPAPVAAISGKFRKMAMTDENVQESDKTGKKVARSELADCHVEVALELSPTSAKRKAREAAKNTQEPVAAATAVRRRTRSVAPVVDEKALAPAAEVESSIRFTRSMDVLRGRPASASTKRRRK
ncbi:hypothetical protein BJ741DRAFT_707902 [Chytriomyces cf. hyalinus JEL632]|nr:hypothetical protein BJ741DRAFT_707902 [Chytriomyces cf. hyalinus JEL632]